MPKIISTVFAALLLVPFGAAANNTFVFEDQEDQSTSTITIGHGMIKVETKDKRHADDIMVYDDRRKVMMAFNFEQKSYMEFDKNTVQKQLARSREMQQRMMPQLMEQLKNLPEEQRALVEERMAAAQAMMRAPEEMEMPRMTSQNTGKVLSVSGINCTVHAVFKDGKPDGKVCVASPKALGLSKADYQTVRGMFTLMRDMAAAVPGARDSTIHLLADAEGVPIKNDGEGTTLVEASKQTLSAASFQPPAGFRKIDPMAAMEGMQ
ncbi:MAG: hypothetical protein ACR2RB_17940 [Gammaproteobacteria bacterium]